jgi:hypothetical protein
MEERPNNGETDTQSGDSMRKRRKHVLEDGGGARGRKSWRNMIRSRRNDFVVLVEKNFVLERLRYHRPPSAQHGSI